MEANPNLSELELDLGWDRQISNYLSMLDEVLRAPKLRKLYAPWRGLGSEDRDHIRRKVQRLMQYNSNLNILVVPRECDVLKDFVW